MLCHTYNGRIRMKKSARKQGIKLQDGDIDEGVGNWLTVSSPDDLFRLNIDVDFKLLDHKPLLINDESKGE